MARVVAGRVNASMAVLAKNLADRSEKAVEMKAEESVGGGLAPTLQPNCGPRAQSPSPEQISVDLDSTIHPELHAASLMYLEIPIQSDSMMFSITYVTALWVPRPSPSLSALRLATLPAHQPNDGNPSHPTAAVA